VPKAGGTGPGLVRLVYGENDGRLNKKTDDSRRATTPKTGRRSAIIQRPEAVNVVLVGTKRDRLFENETIEIIRRDIVAPRMIRRDLAGCVAKRFVKSARGMG